MSESPLEAILRLCAAAAPVPWYPKGAAATLGLTDADLGAFVEQLRGGGLIARTDLAPGYGRGYVLTPLGAQALQEPGALDWLRRGEVPPRRAGAAGGAVPEQERAVRMSLLAPFKPSVTYALLALNVAVFVLDVYLGSRAGLDFNHFVTSAPPDVLHATGAVKASDLMAPGWGYLRLLACCFVHVGLVHLAVNMISLYLVGPLLERMWGHARYLVIYLIAGFGGSCAAMVLRPMNGGNLVQLAGASGALWGLLAAMAVWVVLNYRHLPRRLFSAWGWQIAIAFAINIAITYQMPQLSAEAHYGGGLVGAACALLLHFTRFGPVPLRAVAAAAVAALPAFGLWAVAHPERFSKHWQDVPKAAAKEVGRAETNEMQDRLMPEVKKLEAEAVKLVPGAAQAPLIRQHPTRRDGDQVKRAIDAYGKAEEALRPAADLLRDAGPFHDADVEEARQVRLDLVEARLELYAQNRRCLEAGTDWHERDEAKRLASLQRVQELEVRWSRLTR